jgi:hypothetical protein
MFPIQSWHSFPLLTQFACLFLWMYIVSLQKVCGCLDDHFFTLLVNGCSVLKDDEIENILLELCRADTLSVRNRRSMAKEIQNV